MRNFRVNQEAVDKINEVINSIDNSLSHTDELEAKLVEQKDSTALGILKPLVRKVRSAAQAAFMELKVRQLRIDTHLEQEKKAQEKQLELHIE